MLCARQPAMTVTELFLFPRSKYMKSINFVFTNIVILTISMTAFSRGGIGGGGGSGSALIFVSLGQLFHDSLILNREQLAIPGENEIDPKGFDQATKNVAILPIADENAPEKSLTEDQYGRFLEVAEAHGRGFAALYDEELNSVFLFVQRFDSLLDKKPAAALAISVHEYLRALKLDDEVYKKTAKYYSTGFFQKIMSEKSGQAIVADRIESARVEFEIAKIPAAKSYNEIDFEAIKNWLPNEALVTRISNEIVSMESKIEKDRAVQLQIAKQRDQIFNETRPTAEQLRAIGKAYGSLLRSVNMFKVLSNPFGGGAAADIVEAQFEVRAAAAGIRKKLNEDEALEEQAKFILEDLKLTYDRKKKYTQAKDIADLGPMIKLLKE